MPMSKLLKISEDNNGMITTKDAQASGVKRGSIKYLVNKGELEKVARGIYVFPGVFEDEFFVIQNRFKKGIFSLETALFFHDLTDRTPNKFNMSFPQGYNMKNAKQEGISCTGLKAEFYTLGIEEISTPSGNKVRVYNKERTLVDILRARNKVDIQVVSDAFKKYVAMKNKNIPLLTSYAEKLGVRNRLNRYLEVLL